MATAAVEAMHLPRDAFRSPCAPFPKPQSAADRAAQQKEATA